MNYLAKIALLIAATVETAWASGPKDCLLIHVFGLERRSPDDTPYRKFGETLKIPFASLIPGLTWYDSSRTWEVGNYCSLFWRVAVATETTIPGKHSLPEVAYIPIFRNVEIIQEGERKCRVTYNGWTLTIGGEIHKSMEDKLEQAKFRVKDASRREYFQR
ncbi:MAG: hypothetical protein LBJ92_01805 [Holosporales bacterium]|jgi:hypothetical protein|nr:hypothetical protein [Holosporales bacterium]